MNLETQEKATLHANNNEHSRVIEVKDIVASIAPFSSNGVACNVMSGEEIGAVLSLSTTPDLNNLDHNKFFVSIKSTKMKTITKCYTDSKPRVSPNQRWMQDLASYLLTLQNSDWSISINDLAQGQTIGANLLLLWKFNREFRSVFMSKPQKE